MADATQPSERTPSETPDAKADLARLRIQRGDETATRVGGFPWLRVFAALGVIALLFLFREPLLGLFGAGGGRDVRLGRAVKVVPGQAAQGDVSANGYIVADKQASLASVISGRLVELNAAEGDIVEAGAVVARIQYDDLEARLRQAAAERTAAEARAVEAKSRSASAAARVAEAKSDWEASTLTSKRLDEEITAQERVASQAKENRDRLAREVERNRVLWDARRIDKGTWDRILTDAKTAAQESDAAEARARALRAGNAAWDGQIARRKAAWNVAQKNEIAAAQAEVVAAAGVEAAGEAEKLAEILLEKTRIRAPFRGLVIRKDAEKGEVIAPTGAGNSRGSVLTIVAPESLEVQVELSERRIKRVREGDRALVFLDADPDTGLAGSVRKIWPRADRSKGSIEVRVRLDERPPELRPTMLLPEMAARVVFKGKERVDATGPAYVTVPVDAVTERDGKDVVFVADGDRVRMVPVVRGKSQGVRVVVTGDLAGGEPLVLRPAAGLHDGSRIRADD